MVSRRKGSLGPYEYCLRVWDELLSKRVCLPRALPPPHRPASKGAWPYLLSASNLLSVSDVGCSDFVGVDNREYDVGGLAKVPTRG